MATTKLMTADELLELDVEGQRYELMDGALVAMAPTNEEHATITVTLSIEIGGYVRRHNLGRAISGDPGLRLRRDPGLVLAPDFAFTRQDRLESDQPVREFVTVVPDLIVEVLSPSERAGHVFQKVQRYREAGVQLIWIVNPEARSVAVHTSDGAVNFFGQGDMLEGGDVLPGFSLAVSELFHY